MEPVQTPEELIGTLLGSMTPDQVEQLGDGFAACAEQLLRAAAGTRAGDPAAVVAALEAIEQVGEAIEPVTMAAAQQAGLPPPDRAGPVFPPPSKLASPTPYSSPLYVQVRAERDHAQQQAKDREAGTEQHGPDKSGAVYARGIVAGLEKALILMGKHGLK